MEGYRRFCKHGVNFTVDSNDMIVSSDNNAKLKEICRFGKDPAFFFIGTLLPGQYNLYRFDYYYKEGDQNGTCS